MATITGIDRNVQALTAIERSWTLPKLPDMVKLDMASMSGLDTEQLQRFAYGLAQDVQEGLTSRQVDFPTLPTAAVQQEAEYSTTDRVRMFLQGTANFPAPTRIEDTAVQSFKERAVRLGYLDPTSVVMDSKWDPAYNEVAWRMSQDDFTRRKGGNHPGLGESISGTAKWFDDWLSPTGLLHAATELGLMWDFEQIGDEWGKWDPLGELGDFFTSGNPIHLWRTLGPVDDLLVPVLNWALLASGVGEAMAFSRAVMFATKTGATGAKAFELTYGAGRSAGLFGRAGAAVTAHGADRTGRAIAGFGRLAGETQAARGGLQASVNRMATPGLLGMRLLPGAEKTAALAARGRNISAGRQLVGAGMQNWRSLRGVMIAKKQVQTGMRLGLVSRLETAAGYESAGSARSLSPELAAWSDDLRRNPFVWGFGEALFTPMVFLEAGQVGNPFWMVRSLKKLGGNAYYSDEFAAGVTDHIMTYSDDVIGDVIGAGLDVTAVQAFREARAAEWAATVKKRGASQALADRFTGGDLDQLGAWMTWTAGTTAIDMRAGAMVGGMKFGSDYVSNPLRFDAEFHLQRNKIMQELKFIDPDNPHEVLVALAWSRARSHVEFTKLLTHYLDNIPTSPRRMEAMQRLISHHNSRREQKFAELLAQQMQPGVLRAAVAQQMGTSGPWHSFVEGTEFVTDALKNGDLLDAKPLSVLSPETGAHLGGKPLKFIKGEESWYHRSNQTWFTDLVDVLDDPEAIMWAERGVFGAMNKGLNDLGRPTVARIGTPTFQDKAVELAVIKRLIGRGGIEDTLRRLNRTPKATQRLGDVVRRAATHFDVNGSGIDNLRMGQINRIMDDMMVNGDDQRRIRRIVKYARQQGIGFDEVAENVKLRVAQIEQSPHWSTLHGINSELPIRAKMKALNHQMRYTAKEVDPATIPAALAKALQERGYKLVWGIEYVQPADFVDLNLTVRDMVNKAKWQESWGLVPPPLLWGADKGKRALRGIGRSFDRNFDQVHVTRIYRAQLRSSMTRAMIGVKSGRNFTAGDTGDMEKLIDRLQVIAREIGDDMTSGLHAKRDMAALSPMRIAANVKSSFAPAAPTDLVRSFLVWNKQAVPKLKALGYSLDEIAAAYDGLKGARVVGPQLRGRFTHWLDKLQGTPTLTNTLRALGRADTGFEASTKARKTGVQATYFAGRAGLTGGITFPLLAGYYATNAEEDRNLGTTIAASLSAYMVGRYGSARIIAGTGRFNVAGRFFNRFGVALGAAKKGYGPSRLARAIDAPDVEYADNVWRKIHKTATAKHWAYISDDLAAARDFMRFSLAPIFDASRYTEGMVLSQIGGVPEEVQRAGGLRFNISPSRWQKDRAREIVGGRRITAEARAQALQEWDDVTAEFAGVARARNDFDTDALEAATARFRQVGFLGFNTTEWMASMYADLTRIHGVGKAKAYQIARDAYTYGMKPRSGAEMNVNAIFFPFSFTKKITKHAVEFFGHDWSRAAMLHDSVKTYEILSERYDLDEIWRDRLPFLEKFQRLNPFAYGITPGELGGANRPLINFFNSTPVADGTVNPIINLFLPQAYEIKSEEDFVEIDALTRRILPVWNDIAALVEDAHEQAYVFGSEHLVTRSAEVSLGFDAMAALKRDYNQVMIDIFDEPDGIAALRRNKYGVSPGDGTLSVRDNYRAMQELVREAFPAYAEEFGRVIGNAIIRDQDMAEHVRALTFEKDEGDPQTREGKVGWLLKEAKGLIDQHGGYEYVPAEAADNLLRWAASWAADDDYVRLKWRAFLRSTWGPVEAVMG